jgi:outer membrane murein-binding lipoprotein Lpp
MTRDFTLAAVMVGVVLFPVASQKVTVDEVSSDIRDTGR